jgi:processive rubber oxygenase RoxA-like protein
MEEAKTRNKDRILVDDVRESPVDQWLFHFRKIVVWVVIALVILIIVVAVAWRFLADRPVTYRTAEDHFKYGSIGSEPGGSLLQAVGGVLPPYWIFKALPRICPDLLPGGYASLGLLFEKDRDLPIGVSQRFRLGFEQVGLNCAICHTGTYRTSPQSEPRVVLGMPAHGLDLQRFFGFVTDCTLDARFTADNVIGRVKELGGRLGPFDRLLYRLQLVPRTQAAVLAQKNRVGILLGDGAMAWGAGRVDTFNPYKALQFNWPLAKLPEAELFAASDYPSLWNQKPREGMELHWDGNNDSLDERNRSASLGAGVTPVTIDYRALARVKEWALTLPPPAYPFDVDPALAARGEVLYRENKCVRCHADVRFRTAGFVDPAWTVGRVEPLSEIGTDPGRWRSYTFLFASNQYSLYPDSKHRFTHFRKTAGYANHPLDGIWLRAPYLHNGSVPTLRDLLDAPEARPKVFYRGYDVYDPVKVGFRTDVAEEGGRKFFRFDVNQKGNGNGGHVYGVRLPDADKKALVEYMKRL